MNSRSKKISFLFGSGVSIPAGMPSTQQITDRVLSGENIYRHSSGVYGHETSINEYQKFSVKQFVHRVIKFLDRLRIEVDQFYNSNPFKAGWSYEDLYYIARQISDTELGEFENPAIQPFVDRMLSDFKILLKGKPSETREQWQLHELADESCKYIQDIVSIMLNRKLNNLDYLFFLNECHKDPIISNVDIFTLNHDNVLDSFFEDMRIKYTDGFDDKYPNIRDWNPRLLDDGKFKIKLVKLHGGTDWRRIRSENTDWHGEFIGIPTNQHASYTKDENDNLLYKIFVRPYILVGTYNKMLDYVGGIFDDLFYYFYKSLRETDTLIISGYGFGDRGINTKIIDWIYLSYDHKLIVIHPDPKDLMRISRGSIGNKWDFWIEQNKLLLIEKPIQETNWGDIKNLL